MAKTDELPGVEGEGVAPQKRIKSLDNAIEEWRANVEKRMALTKKECESRQLVIDLMHKHSVTRYPWSNSDDEEKILRLDATEKLKLAKPEDEEGAGEGEGEE
jgi:hypothetical protein